MTAERSETWQRTLWLMVIVRIAMSLSFSISWPFLPLYVIELGVHDTAQVEIWSGLIASINFLSAAIASPFWGALADRYGRKAMVVRSSAAACLFTALMGLCQNVWELFAVQTLAGLFGGFSAASTALVATQVPERELGFSLGWLSTAQLVGALIGPLVGGAVADRLGDYRIVFFATSAGTLLATVLATAFVHETFRRPRGAVGAISTAGWRRSVELLTHPSLLPLFGVLMLAQIASGAAAPVIPLVVRSLVGATPWLATAAGATIAVTGIADLVASPYLGKRSDRIGYRRTLIICLAGSAAFTLPQAVAPSYWSFLALRFGVGVFLGGILPAANALIARSFPREQRGHVLGLSSSATFLGMFVGPLAGGLIAAHFGFFALFLAIGGFQLVNLVLVVTSLKPAAATSEA